MNQSRALYAVCSGPESKYSTVQYLDNQTPNARLVHVPAPFAVAHLAPAHPRPELAMRQRDNEASQGAVSGFKARNKRGSLSVAKTKPTPSRKPNKAASPRGTNIQYSTSTVLGGNTHSPPHGQSLDPWPFS
jgi:hypothetical protein